MSEKKQSVYASIAEDILGKIKNDIYPIGALLPPEREFMGIYSVQRTTVRRGLDILSSEGYIKKVAGLGSVVQSKVPTVSEFTEETTVIKTSVTSKPNAFSILIPHSNMDRLPKLAIDLISALGKNGAFITSDDAEIQSTRAVCIDRNPEAKGGICLALCQSDERRSIILDNDKSAYVALTYLEELGHSSIAYIGTQNGLSFENSAYDAFAAVNSYFDEELVNLSGTDEKSGFDGFSELFRRHGGKFTAVCAVNDSVAKGIIKAAKFYKLNVPEDLSVISLCSSDKNVGIDSIFYDMNELASELLYSLDNYNRIATVMFSGNLVSKGTCTLSKSVTGVEKKMSDFLL